MATLRNKIYKIIGSTTYYVPLARGLLSTAIGSGADDGQLMRVIPYAADITTQGILDMLIDLVENDNSINNEINGINRVICEGVIPYTNYQFDYQFRYISEADGTISLTNGHDWSSVSQTFGITIKSSGTLGSLKTITLNTNCANAAAVAAAINTQFISNDIDDYVQAYVDSYNRIYIRSLIETDPAVLNTPDYNGFVLATGSPNALTVLGIAAGTYAGNIKENTITGGAAKLHESESVYSVYEVTESSVFDSPIVHTLNWYRRDLIYIVFKDTLNPSLVPYLEYVEGEEVDTIPARHTLLSKSVTTTKNRYPLWSILFKNDAGVFKYVEHDRVYNFGGFKETAHLIHTPAFERVLGGFYASLHSTIQFTKPDGTNLDLYNGTSTERYDYARFLYDLESICHFDPSGRIDPQTPDIQFRADLARGDLLTFPFKMTEILDDYAAATDIELRSLKIAIDGNKRTEEGLELHIYTAKYFVDANNFGQVSISTVSVAGLYTTLTLDIDVYATFTQLTANNKDFESPVPFDPPMAGDFIYIVAGKGQYEISMITDVAVGDDSHVIKIQTLPINPDTTSKILIFKASTISLAGTDITTSFLEAQTADDQIDYAEQYPYSTHTGISSLPYHDATYGYQEFGLVGIALGVDTGMLIASEPFYFQLTVDGGTTEEYFFSITGLMPFTFGKLIDVLNGDLGQVYRYVAPAGPHIPVDLSSLCVFELVDGDIRCTSNIAGNKSSILLGAGTVGTNLFDADVGQGINAPLETAVNGLDVSPTYAKVAGTVVMTNGHNWATATQTFVISQDYNGTITGGTVTLNANCPSLALAIAHITAQLAAAGASGIIAERYKEDAIALKCVHVGTTYGFTISEGTGALATLGITAGTFYGGNVDLDDFYNKVPYALNRLFYHMPDPPATFAGYAKVAFPFKIRLNLNQWYFARVSIKDRNIPYMEYGIRPNIVTMDTTWAADDTPTTGNEDQTLNSYIEATVISNAGLYPLTINGEQVFKIEDKFGDITVYSEARNLYYGVGRNLGSFVLEAHNLKGTAYVEPTLSGHVYVDVLNGIVSFNTALAEQPENIWLTYYYNSVLTGAIWTDDVHHERLNGEIWNLQMLIEQLVNPATATMSGSTTAIINISPYQLTSGGGIGDYDFQAGDIIRYDTTVNPQFGWCKAVASNFHYVGDAMVLERISNTEFKIISLGYINNIGTLTDVYTANIVDEDGNNLLKNTLYYLSATVAGKITKNKPDIAQPILLTFNDNSGMGVIEGLVVLTTKTSFFALYDVNQSLTQRCNELSNQADELTRQILELMTAVSFQGGRVSQTSNYILDTFTSIENTSENSIQGLTKPGEIIDDGSSNLNWKEGIEAGLLAFKQGYWRPQHQTYVAETINKYQLANIIPTNVVPTTHTMAGLTYDPVNKCYWLITNLGVAAVGALIKLTLDGRSVHFAGIWYLPASSANLTWHGVASDGFHIYVTEAAMPSTGIPAVSSALYKIPINTNGTIGNTVQYANGSVVAVDGTLYIDSDASATSVVWHDVVIDGDTTIGLVVQSASGVTYLRKLKSTLADTTPLYENIEEIVTLGTTDLDDADITLAKTGNDIFLKVYTASNCAKIFKINLVDDYDASTNITRCSGLFDFADGEVTAGGGITIDQRGDILEAVAGSTTNYLAQRSLISAIWAENQIGGFLLTFAASLTTPTACGVDSSGYYYTADNTAFNIYQFNPKSTVPQYITITGVSNIYDIKFATIGGIEYMFVLAENTGTFYVSYKATSELVFDNAHSYAITGGSANFTATVTPTAGPASLAWNYEDSIMYVLELTNAAIGTITDILGTPVWTADVYKLPDTPVNGGTYSGIAFKNSKIFVASGNTASQIHVLPVKKQSATAWWRAHVYNVPFVLAGATTKISSFDFNSDGDFVALQANEIFIVIKSLENNEVLQVNTVIDDNNILPSTYSIINKTPVAECFFEPNEFSDELNCPDKYYMALSYRSELIGGSGYQAAGMMILNLNEFLNEINSSGNYRYNVTKIRINNLKMGGANLSNCYLAGPKTSPDYYFINKVFIEKDMLFWTVVEDDTNTTLGLFMLDLKSGISYYFGSNTTYYRRSFNGSMSVKNSGNGYVRGVADSNFSFSNAAYSSQHNTSLISRTFSKNDTSDYSEMNPKTFVIFDTNGHLHNLIINWDSFGNRTPQKIIENILTAGAIVPWLPTSGNLFGALGTSLIKTNKPIWALSATTTDVTTITVPSVTTIDFIALDSPCWRIGNIWEHRPVCFGTGSSTISIVDPNNTKNDSVATFTSYFGDVFEDKMFVGGSGFLRVIQKHLFAQGTSGMVDRWSIYENITTSSLPRFIAAASSEVVFEKMNGIALTNSQMFHFGQQKNRCQHETIDFICENPKYYYYRASIKEDGGPSTRTLI